MSNHPRARTGSTLTTQLNFVRMPRHSTKELPGIVHPEVVEKALRDEDLGMQ